MIRRSAIPWILPGIILSAAVLKYVAHREPSITPGQIIEVTLVSNGNYVWGPRSLTPAQLEAALLAESKLVPIGEVHLVPGAREASIGNLIELGAIADNLGAKALYEKDGVLKSIALTTETR